MRESGGDAVDSKWSSVCVCVCASVMSGVCTCVQVSWSIGPTAEGPWQRVGAASKTDWWEREVYDIRTELYWHNVTTTIVATTTEDEDVPRYVQMRATSAPPPWWEAWYNDKVKHTPGGLHVGRLMMDEIIINYR